MALNHASLFPFSLSRVGGTAEVYGWAVCTPLSQCRWLSAAEGRGAYLASLVATQHSVIKKNPLRLFDIWD